VILIKYTASIFQNLVLDKTHNTIKKTNSWYKHVNYDRDNGSGPLAVWSKMNRTILQQMFSDAIQHVQINGLRLAHYLPSFPIQDAVQFSDVLNHKIPHSWFVYRPSLPHLINIYVCVLFIVRVASSERLRLWCGLCSLWVTGHSTVRVWDLALFE